MDPSGKKKSLMLIVDKENILGKELALSLCRMATVVLVTKENLSIEGDVIVVPYVATLPQIPDGLYARMIFVWSEKEGHLVEPLLQKASEQHAELFLVVKHEEKEKLELDTVPATQLVLGDLFDYQKEFPLTDFLQKTKATKRIALVDMGLHVWYPILFSDAIQKIAELATEENVLHKQYFIGPKHQYTALSIAHGLQKVDPDLVIDFVQEKSVQQIKAEATRNAIDPYNAVAQLQKVYKGIYGRRPKEGKEIASIVFAQPKKKNHKKTFWGIYGFYVFFLSIFLPVFFLLICSVLGYFLLVSGVGDIKNGSVDLALQKVKAADTNFSLAQSAFFVVGQEMNFVGQQRAADMLSGKIREGRQSAQIVANGIAIFQSLSSILTGKTLAPQSAAEFAISGVKQESLLLQNMSTTDLPGQYANDLTSVQKLTSLATNVVDELPSILGIGKDVSYLVLFQNNMELRPSGGFIGSYGILKLHNGAIKDFSIHDVYDADGQLKGHVEPPFAIRRYVPLVHLYLRDSNFDPDFTVDAKTVAQLLSQETGERVDGVISVDTSALKTVLTAFGSVYVPSYNETVTDKDFFTLIEKHAEKNFFPGSTQKKDFLRAFATSLIEKFQKKQTVNASGLLSGFLALLSEKHVMVAFSDPIIQAPFGLANLSGSLLDTRTNSNALFNDFSGIVEANLGVNKVNAFITRSVSQRVAVDSTGNVVEKLKLTLTNNSDGSWPGGAYKNFLRFILPLDASIHGVTINNVSQSMIPAITDPKIYEAKSFVAPRGLEFTKESEAGKSVYGFLVTIPERKTIEIEISYTIAHAFSLSSQKQSYSLLAWKQPGVDTYPFAFSLTIPESMRFIDTPVPVESDSQTFTQSIDIAGDSVTTITFASR